MSTTKDLIALAAGFAAGNYTQADLLNKLDGDTSLVNEVIALAGGSIVGGIVGGVTRELLDADPTGIVDTITDVSDDIIDGVSDFFDDIF